MAVPFTILKARTASLVKELEEARTAEEAALKDMEVERLNAEHADALKVLEQSIKADYESAATAHQTLLQDLHTTLNALRRDEGDITTALLEVQRQVSEVQQAFTEALNHPPVTQSTSSGVNKPAPDTVMQVKKPETAIRQTPGVPQDAQFMLTPMGLKYLAPSGDLTSVALPSNTGVEVCFLYMQI